MIRYAALSLVLAGAAWGSDLEEYEFSFSHNSTVMACAEKWAWRGISLLVADQDQERSAQLLIFARNQQESDLPPPGVSVGTRFEPWEDKCELWIDELSYDGKISESNCRVDNLEAALTALNALFSDGEIYAKVFAASRLNQITYFSVDRNEFDPEFFYVFEKESGYPDMLKLIDVRFGIKTEVGRDGRVTLARTQ